MNTNGFYGNLENITNRMATMLLQNDDFVKYLHYTDRDPLSHKKVSNPMKLIDTKLMLQPKPDNLEEKEGIIVEMFFSGDNPSSVSGGFNTKYIIMFNIMCHTSMWKIDNGKRPYRILNIIDYTFNGKEIPEICRGQIIPLGAKFIKFADNWNGYKIAYSLSWNGNQRC